MTEPKQQAFLEAYEPCQVQFSKYCSALTYGKMDTEDLMQEVLVTAYKHFDNIKNKEQLLHYLIRAARNRSISHWRKAKFKSEFLEQHEQQLTAQGATPEVLLDVQLLHQAMNRLPEKQKNALMLFEINGFSMKEIAEMQRTSVGAVKTKISRGRKKLREMMADKRTILALLSGFYSQKAILAYSSNPINVQSLFETCTTLPIPDSVMTMQVSSIIGQSAATSSSWLVQLSSTLNQSTMNIISISTVVVTSSILVFTNLPTLNNSDENNISYSISISDTKTSTIEEETINYSEVIDTNLPTLSKDNRLLTQKKQTSLFPISEPLLLKDNSEPLFPNAENILPLKTKEPLLISQREPLFPNTHSSLFSNSKEPLFPDADKETLFDKPKTDLPLFSDEQINMSRLNIDKSQTEPIQNDSIDCRRVKFIGNMSKFKRTLLRYLKKDKLITSKRSMVQITFKGASIKVNNQLMPTTLQGKYLYFIAKYNILPCRVRLIEITKDYIAIGDILEDGFHGRVDGRVDLKELNSRKIN